jgi:hypothetical protein
MSGVKNLLLQASRAFNNCVCTSTQVPAHLSCSKHCACSQVALLIKQIILNDATGETESRGVSPARAFNIKLAEVSVHLHASYIKLVSCTAVVQCSHRLVSIFPPTK